MKNSQIICCLSIGIGWFALASDCARAQSADQIAAAREILAKVPPGELAAKSTQLVTAAPAKEMAAVAAAVGQAVGRINPELTPTVVGVISSKAPAIAPAVAAAAAGMLADSAAAIAMAAAGARGARSGDVRAAVIAAVPARAAEIVSVLARPKPGAALDAADSGFSVACVNNLGSNSGGL